MLEPSDEQAQSCFGTLSGFERVDSCLNLLTLLRSSAGGCCSSFDSAGIATSLLTSFCGFDSKSDSRLDLPSTYFSLNSNSAKSKAQRLILAFLWLKTRCRLL